MDFLAKTSQARGMHMLIDPVDCIGKVKRSHDLDRYPLLQIHSDEKLPIIYVTGKVAISVSTLLARWHGSDYYLRSCNVSVC